MSGLRPITILTVDDHVFLREGVTAVIAGQPDMKVIAEAAGGQEGIERFRQFKPDVTLMDLRMPGIDGIEAIKTIRAEYPDARIIVLTTYPGDAQAMTALKAGACGYLLKSSLRTQLFDAIRTVHAGKRYIPPEIANELERHSADATLTARELEVLRRVAAGQSNKRIARDLDVTESTIKAHIRSILPKLDASDRTHAVTIALKRGILDL